MAYVNSSSLAGGSAATANVPVPSGTASGQIAEVGIYKENNAAITTVPSGFTLKTTLNTSASARGSLYVFWKRLTGADSGTWNFAWTGSTFRAAAAALHSGRVASGDPFDGTVGTAESTTSVATLNASTSPAAAAGDAVGFWTDFSGGNAWTQPTNYTERIDVDVITLDTRDNVAAGTTGNVSATANVSGFMKAFLGVLAAASTTNSGTLAGTLTNPVGDLAGSGKATGTVAGTLTNPTGSLAGAGKATGTLAGLLDNPSGSLAATGKASGPLAGALTSPVGSLAGTGKASGAFAGTVSNPTGSVTATATDRGALAGTLDNPVGSLVGGAVTASGVLAGTLGASVGSLTGDSLATGSMAAVVTGPVGTLAGQAKAVGALAGTVSNPTGSLAAVGSATGVLSGSVPAPVGSLTGFADTGADVTGILAGTVPSPSGDLSAAGTGSGTLTGLVPGPVAALTGHGIGSGSLSGLVSAPIGDLTAQSRDSGVLAGVVAGPSGSLTGGSPSLSRPFVVTNNGPVTRVLIADPAAGSSVVVGSSDVPALVGVADSPQASPVLVQPDSESEPLVVD